MVGSAWEEREWRSWEDDADVTDAIEAATLWRVDIDGLSEDDGVCDDENWPDWRADECGGVTAPCRVVD